MKLIDLLKVMDGNTFLALGIDVYGMRFEARRTAESFLDQGADLRDREVKLMYVADGELHVTLKN